MDIHQATKHAMSAQCAIGYAKVSLSTRQAKTLESLAPAAGRLFCHGQQVYRWASNGFTYSLRGTILERAGESA